MCGIAGLVNRGDRAALQRMMASIAHRGPDENGILEDPDRGLLFGHLRLAILDLAGGQQPMSTADGELSIVFNGEIYNFAELRAELVAKGVRFVSDHSDTEVLLHGYRQWGAALPERLNGMWAFAILDRGREQLYMSRDRFGKKPLYYHATPAGFAFASELSALRQLQDVPSRIDRLALRKYYAYGYVPAPRTFLEGVCKLPAGHSLTLELSSMRFRVQREWSYQPEPMERLPPGGEQELAEQLLGLLDGAVRRRLVADVPVGCFLSGGIDSSVVTALAMRHSGRDRLRTFSIRFDEADFDESHHARAMAEHIGAQHEVETLSIERALDILPDLAARLDEPIADSSILPTYLLCRHARRSVTVALGGDGADELLAGYDPFKALGYARAYSRLVPRPVHMAIGLVVSRLPVSHGYMSLDFKLKRTFRGLDVADSIRLPTWMAPLSLRELSEVFGEPADAEEIYSEAIDAWEGCTSRDPIERTISFFVNLYLQEDILVKVDRASMLHSLEVRAPFLDREVVDFCRRLPANLKFRGGTTKWLLRKAAASLLPASILGRSKQGFAVPIGRWFADGQLGIDPARSVDGATPFWQRMLDEHRRGAVDHRLALWSNFMLGQVLPGAPLSESHR